MVSMFARLHCATNSRTDSAVLPTFGGWAHTAWPSRECRDALLVCVDDANASGTIANAAAINAMTMFRVVAGRREQAVRRPTLFLLIMIYAFSSSRTSTPRSACSFEVTVSATLLCLSDGP